MTNDSVEVTRFWKRKGGANFVGAVVLGFALSTTTGCDNVQPELAKRGGGFAVLKNGELAKISSDGSLGESCNLCTVGESPDKCKSRADELGVELCNMVFEEVGDDGAYLKKKGAQSSFEIISSARADHHVKMCHVVLIVEGPSSVPISSHGNGYRCREWVGGNDVCECAELP